MKAASVIVRIATRPERVLASESALPTPPRCSRRAHRLQVSLENGRLPRLVALLAAALALPAARADVEFNGFGQIVAGSTLGNQHTFPYLSYTADPSFNPESLFALQTRADLAPSISATAQIVAEGSNEFTPKFAWAYASYQAGEHWTLKGGRQRLPLYEYSDYLQVGEAFPWVRPPPASYAVPLANFDGLSLSGEYQFGKWELHPRLVFGSDQTTAAYHSQTLTVNVANITGAAVESNYDEWLSLRASYFITNSTITSPQVESLLGTLTALGDNGTVAALADDNDQARFASIGFGINRDHLLLGGEYTHVVVDNSFLPTTSGYYLSAGYRFGPLMPLLTYGHFESKFQNPGVLSTIAPVANPNPNPPPPQPIDCNAPPAPPTSLPCDPNEAGCIQYIEYAGAVAGVTCLIQQGHAIDDYYEAGLRYDISSRTALKLDYTRYLAHAPVATGTNLLSLAFTFNF